MNFREWWCAKGGHKKENIAPIWQPPGCHYHFSILPGTPHLQATNHRGGITWLSWPSSIYSRACHSLGTSTCSLEAFLWSSKTSQAEDNMRILVSFYCSFVTDLTWRSVALNLSYISVRYFVTSPSMSHTSNTAPVYCSSVTLKLDIDADLDLWDGVNRNVEEQW